MLSLKFCGSQLLCEKCNAFCLQFWRLLPEFTNPVVPTDGAHVALKYLAIIVALLILNIIYPMLTAVDAFAAPSPLPTTSPAKVDSSGVIDLFGGGYFSFLTTLELNHFISITFALCYTCGFPLLTAFLCGITAKTSMSSFSILHNNELQISCECGHSVVIPSFYLQPMHVCLFLRDPMKVCCVLFISLRLSMVLLFSPSSVSQSSWSFEGDLSQTGYLNHRIFVVIDKVEIRMGTTSSRNVVEQDCCLEVVNFQTLVKY